MENTILVTGAASGIGRAVALLFGSRGWHVGCYDLDNAGVRHVVGEVGHRALAGHLDVTDQDSWRACVADFEAFTRGRLGVLFNSAGVLCMGPFDQLSVADSKKQLDVNVMGVILGIKACLPLLEKSRGAVVNMSSASAVYGQPELAVYSATKFAVRALTEALDIELRDRGVRVVDVMPGYVDTPMVRSQVHRARSLEKLGVKLSPDVVAETVWEAAHGDGLHYMPERNLKVIARLTGLMPDAARTLMRRLAR